MLSILKHWNAIVESRTGGSVAATAWLAERGGENVRGRYVLFAGNENKLAFPAYEKFLARETGAVLILVVGFHERSGHELDRSAQLCGAK